MAKVTYAPPKGEPLETTQFGYHFDKGESVEVDDEKHLAKFRGNPFFVVGDKKGDHTLKDHEERAQRIPAEVARQAEGLPPVDDYQADAKAKK